MITDTESNGLTPSGAGPANDNVGLGSANAAETPDNNTLSDCTGRDRDPPKTEKELGPGGIGPSTSPQTMVAPGAVAREVVVQTLAEMGFTENAVAPRLLEIERQMAALTRSPDDLKARLENMFAVLLEKLEDPKGLLVYNRQRRLFLDILSLHDLILDLEVGAKANDSDAQHWTNYKNVREQLLQVLATNGVTAIVSEVGVAFSPQQQRVVRVVPTDESTQDGCIESIVRDGFVFGPFVLRPTEVVVRKRVSA